MSKGILGGMTDYSHQSFDDILRDLEAERLRTISFRDEIQSYIEKLEANSYWKNVPAHFKNIIYYSLRHFDTTIAEFEDIFRDLKIEVKEHHIKRLQRIANVAQEINVDIGIVWHQQYDLKDYSNSDFMIVEEIYGGTRQMAVNLLDTSNIAERLKDFIGKTGQNMRNNNPWISGSFYLLLAVVVIAGLAVLSNIVHWALLPIIIIGGILLIMIVGILQLKNDDRISDKSFQSLVIETYKRLPLLNRLNTKKENK